MLDGEIATEQATMDHAYVRLDAMRESALGVVRQHQGLSEVNNNQARVEWESLMAMTDQRLTHLDLGDASLVFGRVDRETGESYQIGRLSVLDEDGTPLVVDWRAPAAEPFYRATGLHPMGLVRRRHIVTQGRAIVGIDDEVFDLNRAEAENLGVIGEGALMAAITQARTGRMGDIVATIQREQDEIIRAALPGVLIVQGGPGTGKTAVALHRAAYLLYANRTRLEDSGVLVIGPNRTFLRYIEQVLPSLGEAGVELATPETMVPFMLATGSESVAVEKIKGDARMATVIDRAVRDRQRSLPNDLEIPYGRGFIRIPRKDLNEMVKRLRKRKGTHNERRPLFMNRFKRLVWQRYKVSVERQAARAPASDPSAAQLSLLDDELGAIELESGGDSLERVIKKEKEKFDDAIGSVAEYRIAAERMWPVLDPQQLLHDLFGAKSLLRLATEGVLSIDDRRLLRRKRSAAVGAVAWTPADLPLLDEAAVILGRVPRKVRRRRIREDARWMIEDAVDDLSLQTGEIDANMRAMLIDRMAVQEAAALGEDGDDDVRVFGHVIVDEAQDISPMAWRMIARRNPTRSMTIVGDMGQASRAAAARSWDDILTLLPSRHEPRLTELSVNYRTPSEMMEIASRVLAATGSDLAPPTSVRTAGYEPAFVATSEGDIDKTVIDRALEQWELLGEGRMAIVAPADRVASLAEAGRVHPVLGPLMDGDPLTTPVGVFSSTATKGLEFDGVVLVEPADICAESDAGLNQLYVALTRATRRLTVVHARALPDSLRLDGVVA